jgi:hypothetical protein
LRTETRSAHAANWQPEPNDAFVELHDFVFDDGETLASLKRKRHEHTLARLSHPAMRLV